MTRDFSRRRFLRVGAMASLAALCGAHCRMRRKDESPAAAGGGGWSGIGFGIEMQAQWSGGGRGLGARIERTIQQFEAAFSLYSDQSELSRLNQAHALESASPLFLEALERGRALAARTGGLFQPALHHAWQHREAEPARRAEWLAAADMRFVQVEGNDVRLLRRETELSFNALVQGMLADEVAALLRGDGVQSGLLQMGENLAIGGHPDGRPWKLGVSGQDSNGAPCVVGFVEFAASGMAVSAVRAGEPWLHPLSGKLVDANRVVAVVTREGAAVADAFATAFAVAGRGRRRELARALEDGGDFQVMIWEDARLVFEAGAVVGVM